MNLHDAQSVVTRYLMTGKSLERAPRLVRRALSRIDRHDQADTPTTDRGAYELSLLVHDELMAKAEAYQRRAAARVELADYIDRSVMRHTGFDLKLMTAAEKLRNARLRGTYGRRPNGDVVTIWDDKSGLVRLDPDESREEAQRLAERYAPHLVKLAEQGHGLHYMVATVPNVKPGELAQAKRDIFRRWSNFLRIQREKSKALPEILGSLVVMEDPLSAHDNWNVHLNAFVVTQKPYHEGLYRKIRELWKHNIEMRPVKGEPGDIARAFNELLKYSARVVPEKSQAKASRHASDAPAMIEWPVVRFLEWFEAQAGFRRTRTYGCLYGKHVPYPEPSSLDDVIWLGTLVCRPDRFFAQVPLIDSIPGDKSTTRVGANPATGPPAAPT